MNSISKDAPLGMLGLSAGEHWVKFHVDGDAISFAVMDSLPANTGLAATRKPTGFVQRWGGSTRKIEGTNDTWLCHINEKHLR